jgi:uncharacterized protein YjlB
MIWVLIIGGIILLCIAGAASAEVGEKATFAARTTERTLAYRDYLRRTSTAAHLRDMSDNELAEFIATKIRAYNTDHSNTDKGYGVLQFIVFLVAGGTIGGTQEVGAGIAVVILGLGLASALKKKEKAKIDAQYSALGLHPERPRPAPGAPSACTRSALGLHPERLTIDIKS